MRHFIIVKFKSGFDHSRYIEGIRDLFNNAYEIDGVNKIDLYTSNSDLHNRYDLMIEMVLDEKALKEFDGSWIHERWKSEYGSQIENKVIFDCD